MAKAYAHEVFKDTKINYKTLPRWYVCCSIQVPVLTAWAGDNEKEEDLEEVDHHGKQFWDPRREHDP